jgi:nitrogen fixation NifU-like protein
MRLSDTIREHFERPRNVGTLPDATHSARGTNPVCGDFLTLDLRVENGKITAARFQAEGCAPTYAAASMLTERIVGQEVTCALSLQPEVLIDWLGGVPPGKEHVAALAVGVLRDALHAHTV